MEIPSEQFALIERHLPRQRGNVRHQNIVVINAILWLAENDSKWAALPSSFGKWHSIYARVNRWAKAGVLDRVLEEMQRLQLIRLQLEFAPQADAGATPLGGHQSVADLIALSPRLPDPSKVPSGAHVHLVYRRHQVVRRRSRRAMALIRLHAAPAV